MTRCSHRQAASLPPPTLRCVANVISVGVCLLLLLLLLEAPTSAFGKWALTLTKKEIDLTRRNAVGDGAPTLSGPHLYASRGALQLLYSLDEKLAKCGSLELDTSSGDVEGVSVNTPGQYGKRGTPGVRAAASPRAKFTFALETPPHANSKEHRVTAKACFKRNPPNDNCSPVVEIESALVEFIWYLAANSGASNQRSTRGNSTTPTAHNHASGKWALALTEQPVDCTPHQPIVFIWGPYLYVTNGTTLHAIYSMEKEKQPEKDAMSLVLSDAAGAMLTTSMTTLEELPTNVLELAAENSATHTTHTHFLFALTMQPKHTKARYTFAIQAIDSRGQKSKCVVILWDGGEIVKKKKNSIPTSISTCAIDSRH